MLNRRFALIFAAMCSVALGGCTMCKDDRPPADDKVGTYGKSLGEAKEQVAEGDVSAAKELPVARQRFVASSQVQLGELATEVERRGRVKTIPIERIEMLRKDYWLLVELRQQVLDSTDVAFPDALSQYEAQVDTIREQLVRVDRGQLP